MRKVIITLTNDTSDYTLEFALKQHSLVDRWLKHLDLFVSAGCPWDDPYRFYNFPDNQFTKEKTIEHLKHLISIIKNYAPQIIDRTFGNDFTQDDMNYLHHIFEMYHGLYDKQDQNSFFMAAPELVQNALADLNIWIHRYETLGGIPRFVATWKYKPFRETMIEEDFSLFQLEEQWGDLMLNYCEIGKTLYDLWHDNDRYIHPDAFKPLGHFCVDFTVRFSDLAPQDYQTTEQEIWNYFDTHQDFFHSQGYKKHDPKLSLGWISLGNLVYDGDRSKVIEQVSKHQKLKTIRAI